MKIAMIGPVYPYRGGIAHYTGRLAQALLEEGHETRVFSFRRQYPAWLYPGESDRDPSQEALRTPAEYLLDPLYPWTWFQTASAVAAFRPERVVVHWWTTFWGAPFALLGRRLRRRGLPLVYMIHNVLPHEKRPWDTWLARQALRQGQVFITQTARERERLQELLPGVRAAVHPHPIYARLGSESLTRGQARRLLDLPLEGPVLLFFGIVRPYKGLEVLLEALGRLRERGQTPCLVIAGEFWEDKSRYLTRLQALGLQAQVRVLDRYIPNEEAHRLFTAADLLVAPYTGGTQSGAASLGLGYGLPMIVSEQVAAGIPPENRARLQAVAPGEAQALAEALERFLLAPPPPPAEAASPPEDEWRRLARALVEAA